MNKEISEENIGVSCELRHRTNLSQNLTFDLLYLLQLKIRQKKKRPDVDSIFNNVIKSSATNIDRDVVESILIELINQKIISNKQTSSDCDSLYKSEKSANNSDIIRNSFKNQTNLDASQISLKDFVPPVIAETLQQNMLFTISANRKKEC